MGFCPACSMDGWHERLGSREYDDAEYTVMTCSYCGYTDEDSRHWLDDEDDAAMEAGPEFTSENLLKEDEEESQS